MASNTSHDDAVNHFSDLTGVSANEAKTYLTTYHWDMDQALQAFYEDEDDDTPGARAMPAPGQEDSYTGPRTLDGRPVPYSSGATASSSQAPKKSTGGSKLRTLGDLSAHDDEEHQDDEEKRRSLFAGGEKSGLAVQDPSQAPRDLVRDIIEKARRNAERGGPSSSAGAAPEAPSRFTGSGQTLGGDGVPSRTIPDPRGSPIPRETSQPQQTVERTLHMWEDGFSIDDGPLHRLDDPRNTQTLRMINQGRVPLHLMNINYDEQVDVKLVKHEENWHQLPRIYRPFGGEGRRLGSPVPGDGNAAASTSATTTQAPALSSSNSSSNPTTGLDESLPILTIRIQMPNGARVPARFNTTQTVGDVYEFVQTAHPETLTRNWVLATTFPNKEHIDRSTVLGEMNEFKRGGTAVVKWV
ncbi:hypothetical protein PspLS_02475 [Pyricularia sp. CBS 133598]|nr:hypothetical protein PspLS_02475 [Pyricularia sp. CBS 133598]